MFTSANPSNANTSAVTKFVPRKVTNEMNMELLKVVRKFHPTKAPSLGGFPALFFQKFWDIIGEKTIDCSSKILNDKVSVKNWNRTHIALIPKIK